ncbi:hypothetical protein QOZ96_002893 [Brevundimonas nasdae]|nr:hypothetical protein [Brevundimonas nasdae]MDQ0452933.1 hypothetical protein [Brevundimonas nasdae]
MTVADLVFVQEKRLTLYGERRIRASGSGLSVGGEACSSPIT